MAQLRDVLPVMGTLLRGHAEGADISDVTQCALIARLSRGSESCHVHVVGVDRATANIEPVVRGGRLWDNLTPTISVWDYGDEY